MDRFVELLGKLPSTNARQAVTLVLWLLTGLATVGRYVVTGMWQAPPVEWIGAIAVMSGLDAAQFVGKRRTQHAPGNGETDAP